MDGRRKTALSGNGFTLVEILITLAVFGVILSGIYGAYIAQLKYAGGEHRVAESEVELLVFKKILERDLNLAGFGLADDYDGAVRPSNNAVLAPRPAQGVNSDTAADTLTLMGTALGMSSRVTSAWSYISVEGDSTDFIPPYEIDLWGDSREDLQVNDGVILLEPTAKRLLRTGNEWFFKYLGSSAGNALLRSVAAPNTPISPALGTLVYGMAPSTGTADQPYYAVRYYLGDPADRAANCAPGSASLLRAESRTVDSPDSGEPLLACVRDFQVEFGLDTTEDGTIDTWDHGGTTAAAYDVPSLKRRLKQIRVYALVQTGERDKDYTSPPSIQNGDTNLGANGRSVSLTDAQRRYRWRVINVTVAPRNIR